MRILRIITVFIMCILIGVLIGYILSEREEEVRGYYENIVSKFKKEKNEGIKVTEVIQEEMDEELGEVQRNVRIKVYEGGKYVIYIDEDLRDTDKIFRNRLSRYYEMMESDLDREYRRGKKGVNIVRVVIEDTGKLGEMWFEYSYDRKESVYMYVGKNLFHEHIQDTGWDVLNNADDFWVSGSLKKALKKEYRDRIDWDRLEDK